MKKLLLTLFVIVTKMAVCQQEITTPIIEVTDAHSQNWETYISNLDFKIEYQFVNCDPTMGFDNESVILRISNLTNEKITVSWVSNNYYDKVCNTCNYPNEYFNQLSLTPNQVLVGDCSLYGDKKLKIFSKFNDVNYTKGVKLTSFKLADFNVLTH